MRSFPCTLVLPAFVIMVMASCRKNGAPEAGGTILDKVIVSNNYLQGEADTTRYQYDANGRLSGVVGSNNKNNSSEVTVFTYNTDGTLGVAKESNSSVGDIMSYACVYNSNGQIHRIVGTPLMANLSVDDHTFSYDAQGRMVRDTQFYERGSNPLVFTIYTYDANSNVVKSEQFQNDNNGSFPLISTTTYTYDNNANPWYSNGIALYIPSNGAVFLSKHNIVSENSTPASPSAGNNSSNTASYSYYSNGFVWRQVINSSSSSTTATTTSDFYFKSH